MRFIPGMFRRRGSASAPEKQEAPAPPPLVCDVCGSSDHATDACGIIRPGETGSTWRSGGNANWSSGSGPTFDAGEDFWRRFRGE